MTDFVSTSAASASRSAARPVRFNTSTVATRYSFGVEIECYVPSGSLPVGSYSTGAGGDLTGHGFPTGWTGKYDGSLSAHVSGYQAIEIVSPVLKGSEGLDEAVAVLNKLRVEYRAKVRKCCGLHVHVGLSSFVNMDERASDVLAKVADVVTVAGQSEDALLAATGSASRIGNTYCNSIKSYVRNADCSTKNGKVSMVERMNNRYVTLNVTNVSGLRRASVARSKPTVEFRVFAATMNATKFRAYIQMSLGIVELATTTRTYKNGGLNATARNDSNRSFGRQGRIFSKALEQLFARLCWTSKGRAPIVDGTRVVTMRGWISANTNSERVRVIDELRRLARKLDDSAQATNSINNFGR